MNSNEKTNEVLKSLIIINNDRYEGYKTAAQETKDPELQTLFTRFSLQSKDFGAELYNLMPDKSEAPEYDETTSSGKLYRTWMDIKAAITAQDRKGILASCEFGEDVALGTYNKALETDDISPEARMIVQKHRNDLQQAHDSVKAMRDNAA